MRAILAYHSIDDSGSAVSLSRDAFREHVEWLASGGVPVLPVGDLLALPPEAPGVALTFDDGFRNFGETAWPALRERGLPATVFVVVDRVGGVNGWSNRADLRVPELPLLGWDELGRLAEEGVGVESHGRTHRPLGGLPDPELEDEVLGSARILAERVGFRPRGFAYPYGDAGDRVRAAAARAYDWACTTALRPLPEEGDPHGLPRLDAGYFRRPGALRGWGSATFRLRLRLRRGGRGVRRAVSGRAWEA